MKDFIFTDGVFVTPQVKIKDIRELSQEEWLKSRKSVSGCSDAPKMMLCSKYGNPQSLFIEKNTEVLESDYNKKLSESLQLEMGHVMEPLNIQLFKELNPAFKVEEDFTQYRHPQYQWMMGDFDFMCENTLNGKKYVGECKHHRDAAYVNDTYGAPTDNYLGDEYFWQLVAECAVSGRDGAILVVTGGNGMDGYRERIFERDMNAEKCYIEVGEYFWNECMANNIMPDNKKIIEIMKSYGFEPTHADTDCSKDAIKESTTEPTRLSAELDKAFSEWKNLSNARLDKEKEVKEAVTELKSSEAEAKTKFYDLLGNQEGQVALVDGEGNQTLYDVVNTKSTKYEVIDINALLLAFPNAKEYIKETEVIKTSVKKSKNKKETA